MHLSLKSHLIMIADGVIIDKLGDAFAWDHWHTEREECAAAMVENVLQVLLALVPNECVEPIQQTLDRVIRPRD